MQVNFIRTGLLFFLATIAFCCAADENEAASTDFRPSLLEDEWYSEGWDQIFYFEDGTLLVSQITILNIGFGSHHAGVFTMLVAPGGSKTIIKQSRSNRDWEFSESSLDLEIAKHRLRGQPPVYRVLIRQKSDEVDVTFKSIAAAWPLGRTLEIEEAYQYVSFYAPLAEAEGRYKLGAGDESEGSEWYKLQGGRGFAVRYVNSIGLHDLIRSSTRIVDLEHSALSPVIYTSVDVDGGVQVHLALFQHGQLLHESVDFDLQTRGRIETADKDTRNIPDGFAVNIEEDEFTLTGTVEIEKFLARVDPVDSLKPFVRTIVKLLNTPIQYRYLARYDLDYTKGGQKTRLQGQALMDHMVLRYQRKRSNRKNNTR